MLLAAGAPSSLVCDPCDQDRRARCGRNGVRPLPIAGLLVSTVMLALPGGVGAEEVWDELRTRIVGQSELEAAVEAACTEAEACLRAAGLPRGTVSVRLGRRSGLSIVARTRPRDDDAERCLDTAVRNHTTLLASERIVGRPSTRLVLRLAR